MEAQVWEKLHANILEVIPDLSGVTIHGHETLKSLGANSVDQAEIIMLTMENLKLKLPLVELGKAKNIAELVKIFAHHLQN